MRTELREAGLTENESIIYEALLKFGPNHAGEIARRAGLHRRVVYDALGRLAEKGLVGSVMQNNRRLFQAADPSSVVELLKMKQERVLEALPEMQELFMQTREKEEVNFYKGKNGLKTVMEDQIATGKEVLIIGASPLAYDILQFYFKWFDKRRVANKIKVKVIFNESRKDFKIPYSEIRYLPQKYSSPLAVNVYGDKVALILWSKDNPFAVVVKNNEMVEGYRKYFDLMWGLARKG
ncbi:MAG: helix-turn-helix domain-containing protein [archaeon]